jgi:hypothetical protein
LVAVAVVVAVAVEDADDEEEVGGLRSPRSVGVVVADGIPGAVTISSLDAMGAVVVADATDVLAETECESSALAVGVPERVTASVAVTASTAATPAAAKV